MHGYAFYLFISTFCCHNLCNQEKIIRNKAVLLTAHKGQRTASKNKSLGIGLG